MRPSLVGTEITKCSGVGRAQAEVFGGQPLATSMVEVRSLIDPAMLIDIEADASAAGLAQLSPDTLSANLRSVPD